MFGWLKRKLLKSIIKDIIKKMPKYKYRLQINK